MFDHRDLALSAEVKSVEISLSHLFFIVTNDGVFEFLCSQEVVDMVMISSLHAL